MKMATFARRVAGVLSICVGTAAVSGEVFSDSVRSAALGRDLNFTVYLPDGYKDAAAKSRSCTCCTAPEATSQSGCARAAPPRRSTA